MEEWLRELNKATMLILILVDLGLSSVSFEFSLFWGKISGWEKGKRAGTRRGFEREVTVWVKEENLQLLQFKW